MYHTRKRHIEKDQPFYSYHVFFFPFKWELPEQKTRKTFEEKTKIEGFEKLLSPKWKRKKAKQSLLRYNEQNFFYDFVWPVLYDEESLAEPSFMRHYSYDLQGSAQYEIEVEGKTYRLEIDSILLHLYRTGVGVLSFHLYNRDKSQSAPDDVLRINQYGRRVYPPFLSTDLSKIGQAAFFEDEDWERGVKGTQGAELARRLAISDGGLTLWEEDFVSEGKFPRPAQASSFILKLLLAQNAGVPAALQLSPVLDDRMFVLCWYGNDALVNKLKQKNNSKPKAKKEDALQAYYAYACNDWWYEYIFVDKPGEKSCRNDPMTVDLLKRHTNARWVAYGTLYGVSRYSFVCLTGEMKEGVFPNVLVSHMQSMYYKMVELCLVQRASILRFADEVTEISRLEERDKSILQKVSSLYKMYIRFVNKIYFREVTAQEQGIELYDLLQTHMRLSRDVQNLDGEIQELHQYVMMLEEEKRNQRLEDLTILGALFLIPTFITGYLGMNVWEGEEKGGNHWLILLASLLLAALIIPLFKAENKKFRYIWGIFWGSLLFALMLFLTKYFLL